MNMQEKITAAVAAGVVKLGFDLIENSTYSNIGKFYIQRPNGFDSLLVVAFDFQSGHATFDMHSPSGRSVISGGKGDLGHFSLWYNDAESIHRALNFINDHLMKCGKE
jgi:hypothetical protein